MFAPELRGAQARPLLSCGCLQRSPRLCAKTRVSQAFIKWCSKAPESSLSFSSQPTCRIHSEGINWPQSTHQGKIWLSNLPWSSVASNTLPHQQTQEVVQKQWHVVLQKSPGGRGGCLLLVSGSLVASTLTCLSLPICKMALVVMTLLVESTGN